MQINSFQLKIVACASMLADHIGLIFFPHIIIFRIIGRIAFPIFAFLIAEGYVHTKNLKKYFWRIFIFLIISEPIYLFAFRPFPFENLNIFATLLFGLAAIYLYDRIKNKRYALAAVILVSILASVFGADYGFFGVLLIFSFYLFNVKKDFNKLFLTQFLLIIIYLFYLYIVYPQFGIPLVLSWFLIQFVSLAALFLIRYYNGQRGMPLKYFFYAFYPVHILILGLI
ncbi:MAG: TraX family protein, partial [Candidatus Staskawiczbacteria bacterium]